MENFDKMNEIRIFFFYANSKLKWDKYIYIYKFIYIGKLYTPNES